MHQLRDTFLQIPRERWASYRHDTPLTLSPAEVERLKGQNHPVSLEEVESIYLPLSRLLSLFVSASQDLHSVTSRFLGEETGRVPYIIGVAGSVAVGKSTTSRLLQALLSRWPNHPRVEIITTDGYLYPSKYLEEHGLMARKGYPESYDLRALVQFLADLKAGKSALQVPIYSHRIYDIVPNDVQVVDQPDIVIVEGINVLQVGNRKDRRAARLYVSDFFDFSIYVDAQETMISQWYLQRFMMFRDKARDDSQAFFHRFAHLTDEAALDFARGVWTQTNQSNLRKNILPFRERARLILEKGQDHSVEQVWLRRL